MKHLIRVLMVLLTALALTVVTVAQEDEIDDVADDTEEYIGQTVTLTADLVEVLAPGVFKLEDNDLIADSIPVVVGGETISGFDMNQLAEDDVRVQVSGEVRAFDEVVFAEDYPDMNIDWELGVFDDYDQEAMVIANNVTLREAVDEESFGVPNLDTVLDDPEAFYGDTITLQETLVEAVGNTGFLIEDDDFLIQEQMLVVMTDDISLPVDPAQLAEEDITVRLSGEVRQFIIEDIIADYGIGFDDEGLYVDYEAEPVLVANEVTVIDDVAGADLSQLSVDDITDNPSAYYGQTVTVQDVIVEVIDDNVYLMEEDEELFNEEGILIFYQGPETDFNFAAIADNDQDVRMTGMLYRFVRADFDETLDFDLTPDLYGDYEDMPALVVEEAPILVE